MSSRFFGQYLIQRGRITSQQLFSALQTQKGVAAPIGILALERNWLAADQIKTVLAAQQNSNYRFGELAVSAGLLTQEQVNDLLKSQDHSHRVLLGNALLSKGYLTIDTLQKEFKAYEEAEEELAAELTRTFDRLRHKDVVQTFTDLMIIMFTRFAKEELKIERCELGKEQIRVFRWMLSQQINGPGIEFNCVLFVPPKVMFQMASTMLDEPINDPNDLALEASKEFMSIATGNACARLLRTGLALELHAPEICETTSAPFRLDGDEIVCIHMASPSSSFDMAFSFARGLQLGQFPNSNE
jgi:CheY-specific phosphatase CheX